MTWTRLSDDFTDRPAMLAVSRDARLLNIEALVWCNRLGQDGRFPAAALPRVSDAEDSGRLVEELVEAGLWVALGEGQWQLDWSDQELAEEVNARAEYRATTQRRYRERKARHERGDHTMCDARFCKSAVTGNATSNTNGYETPSRPVPSRPVGRDRDRGADPSGASAPTGRAAGHKCPHGELGGLRFDDDDRPLCNRCRWLAPADLEFLAVWEEGLANDAPDVGIEQLIEAVASKVGAKDYDRAVTIAAAVCEHHQAAEPHAFSFMVGFILDGMNPGCVMRAMDTLKVKA